MPASCHEPRKDAISPRVMGDAAPTISDRLRRWLTSWGGPWRRRDVVLALALGPSVLFVTAFLTERVRMAGYVMPGVQLTGEPMEGLSAAVVQERLGDKQRSLSAQKVRLKVGENELELSGEDVGAKIRLEEAELEVLGAGRTGTLVDQIAWRLARFRAPSDIPLDVELDEARWAEQLTRFEEQALETPREGSLRYERGELVRTEPRSGQVVARAEATRMLRDALLQGQPQVLQLPLEEVRATTTKQALDAAERQARTLLSAPLTMTLQLPDGADPREQQLAPTQGNAQELAPPTVTFSPKDIGPALSARTQDGELRIALEHDALDKILEPIRKRWEQPAQDAQFNVDRWSKITISPSKIQTRLRTEDVERALLEAAKTPERRGQLRLLEAEQPRITTELAHQLNIKELVGQFTTQHVCCQPRVENIHRMADLIDGSVVLPGEVFSINQLVGPRTRAKGFVPAPTIVHGEIDDTTGGGVSQFATTIYNAVFNAGYEIIERQAHSYYFRRYPIGHEATLSFPKPDFIFRNDTKSGVLIKTEYGSTHIRVKIFGDNEGRKVKREVSERFDFVDPPIVYEVNDELSPEETVLVDRGSRGFSVRVSRLLTMPDGQTKTERRKVVYNPRERIVRMHSCKIPEGEQGHTGEECPEPLFEVDAGAEAHHDLP